MDTNKSGNEQVLMQKNNKCIMNVATCASFLHISFVFLQSKT